MSKTLEEKLGGQSVRRRRETRVLAVWERRRLLELHEADDLDKLGL